MSIRAFHLAFIVIVMVAADLFGLWAIDRYQTTQEGLLVVLAVLAFTAGLAMIAYAVWFVRKLNRSHIQ
ncbi:MAG: hypothetical protein ACYTHJ_00755 [Planctomycetota bacterium]|jgi:hypothetical protein